MDSVWIFQDECAGQIHRPARAVEAGLRSGQALPGQRPGLYGDIQNLRDAGRHRFGLVVSTLGETDAVHGNGEDDFGSLTSVQRTLDMRTEQFSQPDTETVEPVVFERAMEHTNWASFVVIP